MIIVAGVTYVIVETSDAVKGAIEDVTNVFSKKGGRDQKAILKSISSYAARLNAHICGPYSQDSYVQGEIKNFINLINQDIERLSFQNILKAKQILEDAGVSGLCDPPRVGLPFLPYRPRNHSKE